MKPIYTKTGTPCNVSADITAMAYVLKHDYKKLSILIFLAGYLALVIYGQGEQGRKRKTTTASFRPVPTFKKRVELASIRNDEGMTSGVELGVQRGLFAEDMLRKWLSCKHYVLVDLWKHQENLEDAANFEDQVHSDFKQQAVSRLKVFEDRTKIEICQNFTSNCAQVYKKRNHQFNFLYVDARHDYKGVLEDLEDWYPLLKPGGIL